MFGIFASNDDTAKGTFPNHMHVVYVVGAYAFKGELSNGSFKITDMGYMCLVLMHLTRTSANGTFHNHRHEVYVFGASALHDDLSK